MDELEIKELVYAGSTAEFEEYIRRYNKNRHKVMHLRDPLALHHVPEGSTVYAFGSYQRRMDYGQVTELCIRRNITFTG